MSKNSNSSRRNFLKLSLAGVIGITVGNKVLVKPVHASELPHLTDDDPQAQALKYVHESPDSEKHCSNCALIQGNDGDEWRPCALFPGKAVNAKGWCSAWVKKP
ncbi:high-potential iron-sulfur protein [Photobacterium minamisatsumaniensis]|uniref:high-potential iron-sulfur protein n=1 Tax=Photobacterium minamisatsumaniensis TaxID=2910233 RepID=UPI003D0F7440